MTFIALFFAGAIIGAFINWAIYSWAMFQHRSISPWMKPADDEPVLSGAERIPIYGWLKRKGKAAVGKSAGHADDSAKPVTQQTLESKYGIFFWLRPFLIEIACAIGLPLFYYWQTSGGLTGGVIPASPSWMYTWFLAHTILLVLMCIGTFIDFDEKTIPDEVTITGTLIALLFAAFAPWFRLPEVVADLAGPIIRSIHHASPHDLDPVGGMQVGNVGLWTAVFIFAVWIWSLLPKLPVWFYGFSLSRFKKSMRFMYAHAMQPKRKTACDIRIRPRSTPGITILLWILFILGMILIPAAWLWLPVTNWESLYGSIIGMAVGGGAIWAVRIVGSTTLMQEAMGFGDVTLMVMIGAFLGWQAVVLACFIAPFIALAIVAGQFLFNGNKAIAFGPYLCGGALIVLLMWPTLWPSTSGPTGVFFMGKYLILVFGAATILMGGMLLFMAWRKGMFDGEDHEGQQE